MRAAVFGVVVLLAYGAAAHSSDGAAALQSSCSKSCEQRVRTLGYAKLADAAAACSQTRHNSSQPSEGACCSQALALFGAEGEVAECLCCSGFAGRFLDALPQMELGIGRDQLLNRWSQCGVPLLGVAGAAPCPQAPQQQHRKLQARTRTDLPPIKFPTIFKVPGRKDSTFAPGDTPEPLLTNYDNMEGLLEYIGFVPELQPDKLSAAGAAMVANGTMQQVKIVGASPQFNNYITGYVAWIERTVPKYKVPTFKPLPPMPDQYKADVAWVKTLKRGAYPDIMRNRPAAFSPQQTDPLQNGEVSRLPPGAAFTGRPLPLPSLPVQMASAMPNLQAAG